MLASQTGAQAPETSARCTSANALFFIGRGEELRHFFLLCESLMCSMCGGCQEVYNDFCMKGPPSP